MDRRPTPSALIRSALVMPAPRSVILKVRSSVATRTQSRCEKAACFRLFAGLLLVVSVLW